MPILTRRSLLALPAALGLAPVAAQAARLTDDGLHTEEWFLESFLDLKQDIEDAAAKSKRLALTFEQRGCPACAEMHEKQLADPAISGYIRQHFEIIQINMFGAREVTDLDGKVLPEKQMARRWAITATPTILFLPEKPAVGSARDLASTRMQGLLPPPAFLAMFRFVAERAYEKMEFPAYLAQQQPGASSAAFSTPAN
ncbi:MAG TPA: thioredoxin family protein [Ferrovibrio sp.]|jgi:thioredoxin-related protein|uniref:thioredoxin family protein n=1 Tax=Ferrovibrio sp. TaxID=1917215 RepID=UPI002ECFE43E